MKMLKDKKTKTEEQRLKEDTEAMRRHYGMLIDHHIIDFDMFENKVGKENVPEILQEYNKILMKCELAEYEADFIGICRHDKVDCALQVPCLLGFKCNHEHEHSNAKMCYLNKQGGELETFLLKNNTSVPKLLEMEKTIAETKQETSETMKEKTTVFVVSSKFCGDFFIEAAFSTKQQAEDFITEREMSSGYITELTLDKPSEDTEDIPFIPTPRHEEDFDEIQKAVLRKIHNEEKSAENKRQETSKVPQLTSYGECTHPQDFCDFRSDKGECLDVGDYQICKHNTEKTAQNTEERINHPKHYQHPSGVECITVARHHDFNIGNALKYIWRAGLKQEQGLTPIEKQIEDLQKAAFYIQDEIQFLQTKQQKQ